MQNAIRRRIKIALLSASLVVLFGPGTALAQSGSAGGSIGNDEKSISGSRQAPRSVEPEQPARRGLITSLERTRMRRTRVAGPPLECKVLKSDRGPSNDILVRE